MNDENEQQNFGYDCGNKYSSLAPGIPFPHQPSTTHDKHVITTIICDKNLQFAKLHIQIFFWLNQTTNSSTLKDFKWSYPFKGLFFEKKIGVISFLSHQIGINITSKNISVFFINW